MTKIFIANPAQNKSIMLLFQKQSVFAKLANDHR